MAQLVDQSLGTGVWYERKDLPGFFRRASIVVIEAGTIAVAWAVAIVLNRAGLWETIDPASSWVNREEAIAVLFWPVLLTYLVVSRARGWLTPGYWLTGCRLVNLQGGRPGLGRAFIRESLIMFHGLLIVMDLVWCGCDRDRRSIRDCWSGTMVIRRGAQPAGTAPVCLQRCFMILVPLFYPRVAGGRDRDPDSTSDGAL